MLDLTDDIDWQSWNISVGETRTSVNIVLKLHNANYATWIIYSQLFISFLLIASSSTRCTQLVQWLNYAEIGDVIGTRSLIYRRFSSTSLPPFPPYQARTICITDSSLLLLPSPLLLLLVEQWKGPTSGNRSILFVSCVVAWNDNLLQSIALTLIRLKCA